MAPQRQALNKCLEWAGNFSLSLSFLCSFVHKDSHEEHKEQQAQVASREVSSQHREEIFYSENDQSLEKPSQGCSRIPITEHFQIVTGQGDT